MKGIINVGNTCYMNSAIQAISSIYSVVRHLINNESNIITRLVENAHVIYKNDKSISGNIFIPADLKKILADPNYKPIMLGEEQMKIFIRSTMTWQLIRTFRELWNSSDTKPIVPLSFRKVFEKVRNNFFQGVEQHDAEEAFSCIIQQIQLELSVVYDAENNYPVAVSDDKNLQSYSDRRKKLVEEYKRCVSNDILKAKIYSELQNLNKEMPIEYLNILAMQEIKKTHKDTFSMMGHIFSGFMNETTNCPRCHHVKNHFVSFQHMSLSLPTAPSNDINDCLKSYFSDETLSEDDKWNCPSCKNMVRAVLKKTIWSQPHVLVLQLKRFSMHNGTKDRRLITYDTENLDISKYITMQRIGPAKCSTYRLQSIICHTGYKIDGGHYYTIARNGRNVWTEYNDAHVRPASDKSVVSNETYMLVYIRTDQLK